MGGTLIYKCRNCGAIDRSIHVPHGQMAMYMIMKTGEYSDGHGGFARLYELHTCDKNTIGMTDFIGIELDGYEVIK